MADENKPAFYPRVGRNIAKNFRSAQPAPFINDPRAMELPQYGDVDLSQPTKANLELGRRMTQRDADLKRQQSADTSPLEKAAGALQTVRLMGSALTQAINSLPTRMVHGDAAAEKFIEDRMYKPEQPLAYEYAGDVGDFLEKLETQYKLPPILPEAVALQYLTGPATSQAMRTAGRGAEQTGRAIERRMEPVVKGALERGGLPREMVMAMGQGTQSNIMKREGGNWLNNLTDPSLERLKTRTGANNDPAETLRQVRERFTPEEIEALPENSRQNVINGIAQLERDVALNNWIDSNLSRYVKNEMGTPSDPIRLLIEKREDEITAKFALDQQRAQRIADRAQAEPDSRRKANLTRQSAQMMEDAEMNRDMAMKHKSHLPPDLQNPDTMWTPEYLAETRKRQGFPEEETGKTRASQMWEQMADETIYPANVGEIQGHPANMARRAEAYLKLADFEAKVDQKLRDKFLKAGVDEDVLNRYLQNTLVTEKADVVGESELGRKLFNDVGSLPSNLQFLDEASSKNPWISKLDPKDTVYSGNVGGLNFDHVLDVLKEDLAAGRIRPEQLNKMSMEQAVRRTAEYDLELAKKMNADRASARADLPVYKEYPEGYKWVQLNRPSDFAAESDAMGHSVRGYEPPRGHPDWTDASGDYGYSSYGLGGWDAIKSGDAKVYSLVDAKGEPHVTIEVGKNRKQLSRDDLLPYREAALEEAKKLPNGYTDYDLNDIEIRMARENLPPYIKQIKGKGNDRPINKYDPYTQDFVTGGNWEFVDDLQNTGLKPIDKVPERARFESAGMKLPKYLTDAEHENLINEYMKLTSHPPDLDFMHKAYGFPKPDVPPDLEGMRRGGVVISNNPDTMMLELGNKRMKEGGSEDDTKPYFGGAGTKKYAAAKKRAEQGDVNTLKDPKTYAAVAGLMGERPDEMGFSVLHPDYQGVREAADPAFYAGTALGVAPLMKVFKAPAMALGRAGEKYAEKVVPQIMDRGGIGADILGGLAQGTQSNVYLPHTLKKPDPTVGSRYKTQYVGNLAPKFDFDIQAEQGSSVMSNPWDLTSRGEKVLEVSDIPMSNQMITEGGHDFARDIANIKATIGGASGRQIAERMQDRVNDATFANLFDKGTGRVFTMPSTMDVKGSHFSTMPTDLVMDIFQQRGLKPKEVERITDDLRTFVFETEKGKFKNAAPVGSPEFMLQLRQGGKGFSAGDLRKGLMDRMSKSEYQQMLGYNIEDVYGAIGDQALKGLPKGFVGNTMIETSPFAGLKPATHQSYDTANMGKYAGSMPSMPLELMMPDLFRAIEINYLKDPRYRKLTPLQLRTMIVNTIEKRGNVISQPINQRVVDNVMRYKQGLAQGHFKPNDYDSIMEFMRRTGGYKDGGSVKKPTGAVKQPAAYIDGNEFVEAAQKYGIRDSMNNLNMIVNLVNKGLTVDDAARQVADSGMHKAEGGEVTGDDLIIEERPL